ncbi:MAG: hypothetical protein K940chlam3_01637 [Chlamydiae bacterium]|nr:hypothetical protein [Chlamydiota bacterium]
MVRFLGIILLLFLTSCGPQSLEDYRREGRESVRALTNELRQIQTRQDLVAAAPLLKKQFNRIVDLMIAARETYESHPGMDSMGLSEEDHEYSNQLRVEIERISRIEGAEKLLAKCQEEALNRLHVHQQRILKAKNTRHR